MYRDPIERLMSSINYSMQHQNPDSEKYNGSRICISNSIELNDFVRNDLKRVWGSDPIFTFQNSYLQGGTKHIQLIIFNEFGITLKKLGFSPFSKQISKNVSKSIFTTNDLDKEVQTYLLYFFRSDYQLLNDFQVVKF